MKRITSLFAFLVLNSILEPAQAQGTFQNLDFEAATVPSLPLGQSTTVSASAAFPGWIAYQGTNAISSVQHNGASLGGVTVSIMGPISYSILNGNFTASLQGGRAVFPSLELLPASLAQVGTLPTGIYSVMFHSAYARPEVRFNGQLIPVALMGSGVSSSGVPYEILGGDISSFAGLNGELRFSSLPPASGPPPSLTLLDNILFSNQPIPEPGALGLLGLGALLFGRRWQRAARL